MYMSKNEEKALAYLIDWAKQLVLLETYCIKAKKEREQTNARTWEYIKEKRKSNPDYGRPKRKVI